MAGSGVEVPSASSRDSRGAPGVEKRRGSQLGGRWPYNWTETLLQQVPWGVLRRDAMRMGSGRHQSCDTEWMPRRGHTPPGRHVGKHQTSLRRGSDGDNHMDGKDPGLTKQAGAGTRSLSHPHCGSSMHP